MRLDRGISSWQSRTGRIASGVATMMYVSQSLKRALQVKPAGIATIFRGRRRTWVDSAERIARLAAGFKRLGLSPGGRVAILALNGDRYFEFMYAAPWLGAVMVPINTRLAAPEIDYILEDSDSEILLLDDSFLAMLDALGPCRGKLRAVVHMGDGPAPSGLQSYEALIDANPPIEDQLAGGETLAGIFYTGGTTGKSKGVMLSHDNLVSNAANAIGGLLYNRDTVYLHAAPMFHLADGASTFGVTMVGGTHAFVPKFDPAECVETMARDRVTNAALVPTMINMLVHSPAVTSHDLSGVQQIMYGASPMPEATLLKILEVLPKCRFVHGWGMTELSPIGSLLDPRYTTLTGPYAGRIKSCGQAALTAEVRIVDAEDREVPRGTVGEIVVRGPMVMLGYWKKPEATRAALRDGWMHTGDAAYMDEEGFIFIVDRLKDMVISGGENIYCGEVENAISLLPGVMECAVIGIPDERWGEAVHAVVVPKPGTNLTPEAVIAPCRTRIAHYKCPRSVAIRTEPLPLSGAGKILKTSLREPFWRGKEKRVN